MKWCVFSPDGQLFASASHDCTVRIWHGRSTECVHILSAHSRSVETVSFSPDGMWLVSGGWDTRALIWSVQVRTKHLNYNWNRNYNTYTYNKVFHLKTGKLYAARWQFLSEKRDISKFSVENYNHGNDNLLVITGNVVGSVDGWETTEHH